VKVQESRKIKKAEITAFLSLIFILLITFIGGIADAASIQVAKNYRRSDAERAMECIFAEYQKELLKDYDIFGFDAGYESGEYAENLISKRMEYYGFVNSTNTIERIKFLSDDSARSLVEQVSYYMEHKYGLSIIQDALSDTDTWESQESKGQKYEEEEKKNKDYLEELLEENGEALPENNNPIAQVDALKQTPVLELAVPEGMHVSEKTVNPAELPSRRNLNQGFGDFSDEEKEITNTDKLLFGEYILEHFDSFTDQNENILNYEVEYMIAGKDSDRENLQAVVNQLLILRFVPNYTSLQTNAEKKAEADALALTLCSLLTVPAITEAVSQGILLAWAFSDSLSDVETLLSGGKVSLTKDNKDGNGLCYEDYLKILLFLEKKEGVAMRCLDLIEQNLKKMKGLDFFRVDTVVTKMEIKSRCSFRRGITYTFPVYFGYR